MASIFIALLQYECYYVTASTDNTSTIMITNHNPTAVRLLSIAPLYYHVFVLLLKLLIQLILMLQYELLNNYY